MNLWPSREWDRKCTDSLCPLERCFLQPRPREKINRSEAREIQTGVAALELPRVEFVDRIVSRLLGKFESFSDRSDHALTVCLLCMLSIPNAMRARHALAGAHLGQPSSDRHRCRATSKMVQKLGNFLQVC
jgi:hypothetical protein